MKTTLTLLFLILGVCDFSHAQNTNTKPLELQIAELPSVTEVLTPAAPKVKKGSKPKKAPPIDQDLKNKTESKIKSIARELYKSRDLEFEKKLSSIEKNGNDKTGKFPTCLNVAKAKKKALQQLLDQDINTFWKIQTIGDLNFYKKNIDAYIQQSGHKIFREELSKSISELSTAKVEPTVISDVSVGGTNYILGGKIAENGVGQNELAPVRVENFAKRIAELKTNGQWSTSKKDYVVLSEASSYWDDSDGKKKISCWGQLLDIKLEATTNNDEIEPEDVKYELGINILDGVKEYLIRIKASVQHSFSDENGEVAGIYRSFKLAVVNLIIINTEKRDPTNYYIFTIGQEGFFVGGKKDGFILVRNREN